MNLRPLVALLALAISLSVSASAEERLVVMEQKDILDPPDKGEFKGVAFDNYATYAGPRDSAAIEAFKNKNTVVVYTKGEVDVLLAEKDQQIAQLKAMVERLAEAHDALAKRVSSTEAQ
jgi:hypothetical protein